MSIQPLPKHQPRHHNNAVAARHGSLQQRFFKQNGRWFINAANDQKAGPYNDKADAQTALLYYSTRTCWPSAKQLRAFTRCGR